MGGGNKEILEDLGTKIGIKLEDSKEQWVRRGEDYIEWGIEEYLRQGAVDLEKVGFD